MEKPLKLYHFQKWPWTDRNCKKDCHLEKEKQENQCRHLSAGNWCAEYDNSSYCHEINVLDNNHSGEFWKLL